GGCLVATGKSAGVRVGQRVWVAYCVTPTPPIKPRCGGAFSCPLPVDADCREQVEEVIREVAPRNECRVRDLPRHSLVAVYCWERDPAVVRPRESRFELGERNPHALEVDLDGPHALAEDVIDECRVAPHAL